MHVLEGDSLCYPSYLCARKEAKKQNIKYKSDVISTYSAEAELEGR